MIRTSNDGPEGKVNLSIINFLEDDEDKLVLPSDYLTAIYNPGGSQANLFLVHPSHRYSGSFSAFAIGMKYQVCT